MLDFSFDFPSGMIGKEIAREARDTARRALEFHSLATKVRIAAEQTTRKHKTSNNTIKHKFCLTIIKILSPIK